MDLLSLHWLSKSNLASHYQIKVQKCEERYTSFSEDRAYHMHNKINEHLPITSQALSLGKLNTSCLNPIAFGKIRSVFCPCDREGREEMSVGGICISCVYIMCSYSYIHTYIMEQFPLGYIPRSKQSSTISYCRSLPQCWWIGGPSGRHYCSPRRCCSDSRGCSFGSCLAECEKQQLC